MTFVLKSPIFCQGQNNDITWKILRDFTTMEFNNEPKINDIIA